MGCWNKTCGLTGLYIRDSEPVYVFVMEKNDTETSRCYTTAYWSPCLLPFQSKYNDYGGGYDSHGFSFDLIMKRFKKAVREVEPESEYDPFHLKRSEFDEKMFFDAAHEQKLYLDESNVKCDFVMMRKDIVDNILNNWNQDIWSNGKYMENTTYNDFVKDIPEFLTVIATYMTKNTRMYMSSFDHVFPRESENMVNLFLNRDLYKYSYNILQYRSNLIEYIRNGEFEKAAEYIKTFLIGYVIDCFMSDTRKCWIPAAHEGSQSQSEHAYRFLNKTIQHFLDNDSYYDE